MKQTQTQSGFSALYIILALVAIAALAATGWYTWRAKSTPTPSKSSAAYQTQQPSQRQSTPNKQQPADPSESGKYLVIKEWRVRFPVPESLRGDVTYKISASNSDSRQTAWFEVGKIANLPGSNCKLTDANMELGGPGYRGIGVYLVRSPDKLPQEEIAYYYAPNIPIDSYWFSGGIEKYAEACVGNDDNRQLAGDTGRFLVYSLDKIEKIQQ